MIFSIVMESCVRNLLKFHVLMKDQKLKRTKIPKKAKLHF